MPATCIGAVQPSSGQLLCEQCTDGEGNTVQQTMLPYRNAVLFGS